MLPSSPIIITFSFIHCCVRSLIFLDLCLDSDSIQRLIDLRDCTASATVGTVEVRSLCESWRKIIARVRGHFIQSKAVGLEMSERLLEVEGQGGEENFYIPYDRLILAMGSTNSTHGVPGLENCFQLKTVSDAQAIRRRIMENLERSALPTVADEERRRLLSFVICGGVGRF